MLICKDKPDIATVALRMAYKRLACCISGLFHLTREAFRCVLGEAEAKFHQSLANPGKICGAPAGASLDHPPIDRDSAHESDPSEDLGSSRSIQV
jgi:hypothetical protein